MNDLILTHLYNTTRLLMLTSHDNALRDRMLKPEPGDLVIEVSAWPTRTDLEITDKVGWLLYGNNDEGYYVIEPWDRSGDSDAAVTWENSQWFAVPNARHFTKETR